MSILNLQIGVVSMAIASPLLLGAVVTVLLLLVFAAFFYSQRKRSNERARSAVRVSQNKSLKSAAQSIWTTERTSRWNGLRPQSSFGQKVETQSCSKPFGSKYYYAHNDPNAKGGYKDGLRMEDYTMNGPRLLSSPSAQRHANSESETTLNVDSTGYDFKEEEVPASDSFTKKVRPQTKRMIAITQYLWDDPGTGCATIRIDHVPHPYKSNQTLAWKEIHVKEIRANRVVEESDEGIEVVVESDSSSNVEFRLYIPKLYGPINAISVVQKQKRLLVKLEKKTTFLNKSNVQPWPHPHKKLL